MTRFADLLMLIEQPQLYIRKEINDGHPLVFVTYFKIKMFFLFTDFGFSSIFLVFAEYCLMYIKIGTPFS